MYFTNPMGYTCGRRGRVVMAPHVPLAIFGGPLEGCIPVRYVFVDEAGTSAKEPLSVVVGIIAHADKQCIPAEHAVNKVLDLIPHQKRDECPVFHATQLWGDPKLREDWPLSERKHLLCSMMAIPSELNLAIAMGVCRRTTELPVEMLARRGITLDQAHHGIAFQECIARADSWINKYARPNEVATVLSEDVPRTKTLLKHLARYLLEPGYSIPKEDVRLANFGDGAPLATVDEFRNRKISRIRLPIHFVEKQEEPLLQIADACAFGMRRFLNGQSHGQDFANAIIGGPQKLENFPIGEWSGGIFRWADGATASYSFGPWRG